MSAIPTELFLDRDFHRKCALWAYPSTPPTRMEGMAIHPARVLKRNFRSKCALSWYLLTAPTRTEGPVELELMMKLDLELEL